MYKHTPGPWVLDMPTVICEAEKPGVLKHPIASTDVVWSSATQEEKRANARLIAASPDLLYVAEQMREFVRLLKPVFNIVDPGLCEKATTIEQSLDLLFEKIRG